MARRGSLPVYTEALAEKVLMAIKVGATYEHAAAHADISRDTFDRWRKGLSGAPADFAARVVAAEGAGAVMSLAQIQQAAQRGDWRAASWMLEHRHAAAYGKPAPPPIPETVNHDHSGTVTHLYDFSQLTTAERLILDAAAARLEPGEEVIH